MKILRTKTVSPTIDPILFGPFAEGAHFPTSKKGHMKTRQNHLRKLALGALIAVSSAVPAQAALTMYVTEVGSDIVLSQSGGSLNLTGLEHQATQTILGNPSTAIDLGRRKYGTVSTNMANQVMDFYNGFSLPLLSYAWGSFAATSGVGPTVVVFDNHILLPKGYKSGEVLAPSWVRIPGQTLESLGLKNAAPLTWEWETDSITVNFGAVPEPTFGLVFGMSCMGFLLRRSRRNAVV